MLREGGGLEGLPALTFHSLVRLGLTETKAAAVLAAVELARRLAFAEIPRRHPLRQPAEVARYLTLTYGNPTQEVLGALFLNGCYRLLSCREIYRGTLTQAAVEPRAILKEAILAGASVIVLFHTHPSGDLQPSGEDILFTHRMVEAAATVGIRVQDHLILGELGRWVSLHQRGKI
jgi:DNA repair protein RadC